MLKKTPLILLIGTLSAAYSLSCPATTQVSQAELLAVGCFSCHGHEGVGAKRIPKLSKLSKQDISESLYGFKSGEERSTIMERHAKAYTDKEIALLAEYFANLKNK
ncbi:hypothetical protein MNBD_GAMMA11-3114 [hydrothermal vent metagenome]|uniref:Cytochrome c domain-containing protein n=1 Tax=hydrothermal vent metagenome TaxID=652676 RepID=A0A3B0Y1T8_9ZZZZ